MSKKILHVGLAEKIYAHSFCSFTHLHRNGRIFLTEICMTFSCIYDHKSVTHILERKSDLLTADIFFVRKIQKDRAAGSTRHLVHQAGSFFPVYILCVLSCSCVLTILQFSFIKEMIGDGTNKHLKRCGRADTCCCNNLSGNISIKTTCCIAFFLHIFHDTCNKCICSLCVSLCAELVKFYNNFLFVSFTYHMDHISSVRACSTNSIKVDTCSNDLSAVMVNMVSDDLRTSWCSEKFCIVMMILFLKVLCQACKTCTALFCFSVNFFQQVC